MESISEIDNSKTSNVTLFICLFIKQGHKRKSKALKTFWFRFRQGRQAHEAWFRLVASETQPYMKKSAFDNILKVKGNYHKCPCGVSTIFGNNIVKISLKENELCLFEYVKFSFDCVRCLYLMLK